METSADKRRHLLDKWSISWPILNVLIGGRSSIDLPDIQITGWDEAGAFLRSYGYDPERTHDARMIHATIIESLGFIERNLMAKEWKQGVVPPPQILNCTDARDLLIWSCDRAPENNLRRIWSCAVLRVMHTIAHIEGAFRYSDIDSARDEIMARFESILVHDGSSTWMEYGDHRVPIYKMEWKTHKSRESILLKLLHKRANVAETIYDMIGLRIVAPTQADALQIIRMLYKSHVLSFPNAIPSRSRNSLVDSDVFHVQLDQMRGELMTGAITPEQFEAKINSLRINPPVDEKDNQHSGADYQAIQLTCRQLIRTPRPLSKLRKSIEQALVETPSKGDAKDYLIEVAAVLKNISRIIGDEEFAFFPFEVQVMDQKAWEVNSTGRASHGKYKKSQLRAARRRVLNEILPLS